MCPALVDQNQDGSALRRDRVLSQRNAVDANSFRLHQRLLFAKPKVSDGFREFLFNKGSQEGNGNGPCGTVQTATGAVLVFLHASGDWI